MVEEMVIDGYNVVVNLDLEDEYLYLSSVNGIEVTYLSDSFALYIEAAATDAFWKEVRESCAERKINQLEDKQFFKL